MTGHIGRRECGANRSEQDNVRRACCHRLQGGGRGLSSNDVVEPNRCPEPSAVAVGLTTVQEVTDNQVVQ